jgi:CUG-BP- and ETR3-like factor
MASSWSEKEVALWLQEQGFGEFEDAFVSNKIDGRAIVNLSKEDFDDLGVKLIGRRAALVAAIVECFGKCAASKVEAVPASYVTAEADDAHLAHERIKLFVGGLPESLSKETLHQELQQFAPVDEVIILLNPGTGTSKGSGFAFVVGKKNADALISAMRDRVVPSINKALKVDYALGEMDRLKLIRPFNSEVKLFIGNLPREYSREQLDDMLKKFKPKEIHCIPLKDGLNSKGSAFCMVSSMQVARQVIAELDGQYTIPGHESSFPVTVKVAESDQEKLLRKSWGGQGASIPMFQTQALTGSIGMNAMTMDPYFMMQQQQLQQQQLQQQQQLLQQQHYGGAAMGYDPMQQYSAAASGAYGPDHSQFPFNSSVMQPNMKLPGIGGGATHAGPPGANVFVFNLPLNLDEGALVQLFSRFGQIVSTRVCKDMTSRQSKGYGFVSFTQEQSALSACAALNGFVLGDKKLTVEIKDAGGRSRNSHRANPY